MTRKIHVELNACFIYICFDFITHVYEISRTDNDLENGCIF